MRSLAAIVLALALVFSASAGPGEAQTGATTAEMVKKKAARKSAAKSTPAKAASKQTKAPKQTVAVKSAKGQKVCRSRQPTGAIKTWTCGQTQPCCVNHTLNIYTCVSQLLTCF